ncbi:MAG: hypothetical protein AAF798_05355 [Bacteroidota bacterium]
MEQLLRHLAKANIEVVQVDGKYVQLPQAYQIEVENSNLFKLTEDGYVIAPFGDLDELCDFLTQCLS